MSSVQFSRAIVRAPGRNFADGLTTATLGIPDLDLTLRQHAAYCAALEQCGLELTALPADERYPDSTFVEDTAVLTEHLAVLTHPGAASREGEVAAIADTVRSFYQKVRVITAPGALDGGDICEAGSHFFIGLSERTNAEGGRQLAAFLAEEGFTASFVTVTGVPGILHLKSGISYLGDNNMVLIDALADLPDFQSYNIIRVSPEENYAANCVRVNDDVLIPAGFPKLKASIEALGYRTLPLSMTEFEKMDGGLSCLSLRF